ncbi:hypothetical protein [Oryza sativa Japonica Group]|uniref:Uncharacterized protein n=1 Tax=Oryza sativa subsp. japonica TaxID=39947 RepID=Q9LJ00_ORYSJ|nr:hypothetical protein [Oryza sativa Japonica Group]
MDMSPAGHMQGRTVTDSSPVWAEMRWARTCAMLRPRHLLVAGQVGLVNLLRDGGLG